MRNHDLVPTGFRGVLAPLLLTAAVATWAAIAVQSWLYTLVVAAVGVADLPLIARTHPARDTDVGVLVVGWGSWRFS